MNRMVCVYDMTFNMLFITGHVLMLLLAVLFPTWLAWLVCVSIWFFRAFIFLSLPSIKVYLLAETYLGRLILMKMSTSGLLWCLSDSMIYIKWFLIQWANGWTLNSFALQPTKWTNWMWSTLAIKQNVRCFKVKTEKKKKKDCRHDYYNRSTGMRHPLLIFK